MDYSLHDSKYQKSNTMTTTSPGLGGPLYQVEQVPEHFHELFILRGYRHPRSSAKQCILSVFDATNETLNFWTHFLPSWYFMYVLKGLAETVDFKHDSYTWPLLAYMFVCCIFPLASAVAHTFNTMSENARHICFFLDYSALSLFTFGVALAYKAYVFPVSLRNTWFGDAYVPIAAFNAIFCTVISCQTRFMKPSLFRKFLRLGSFALPYLYDSLPVIVRITTCSQEECHLTANYLHVRQFVFAFLAAFLYVTHLPERLHPGKFDIIGHSHQLFHVSSILGTFDQLQAVLQDMQERRSSLQPDWEFTSLRDSIGSMSGLLFINTVVILLFSLRLLNSSKKNV